MESLDCRSPARCATCEHFVRGACALEADVDLALAALAPRRPAPAIVVASRAALA